MRRRLALTSLILVLVPTLLFAPVYIYLVYSSYANIQDYSEDVQGRWTAIQYYRGSERVACGGEDYITIDFDRDTITVSGTVLPEARTGYSWIDGTSLTYEVNGEPFTYLLSFADNNLKIIVDGTQYILLLRRAEG